MYYFEQIPKKQLQKVYHIIDLKSPLHISRLFTAQHASLFGLHDLTAPVTLCAVAALDRSCCLCLWSRATSCNENLQKRTRPTNPADCIWTISNDFFSPPFFYLLFFSFQILYETPGSGPFDAFTPHFRQGRVI